MSEPKEICKAGNIVASVDCGAPMFPSQDGREESKHLILTDASDGSRIILDEACLEFIYRKFLLECES